MFKAIKFIADLVSQNNDYQRLLSDIILQLHNPSNQFILSDIDEANYIFENIRKLQKENTELKKEFDLLRNEVTVLVEKYSNTPDINYKEDKEINPI